MSAENPPSGQFKTGQTYDPANITGSQWLITDDDTIELTEPFTLGEIRTTGSETVGNVSMEQRNYEANNYQDLKNLSQQLLYERAQIEAREKALKQASGASGFLGGIGSGLLAGGTAGIVVVLIGGVAVVVMLFPMIVRP
jgi:hypothetical protein